MGFLLLKYHSASLIPAVVASCNDPMIHPAYRDEFEQAGIRRDAKGKNIDKVKRKYKSFFCSYHGLQKVL